MSLYDVVFLVGAAWLVLKGLKLSAYSFVWFMDWWSMRDFWREYKNTPTKGKKERT